MAKTRVPVTARALIQRINRKLAEEGEVLKAARGAKVEQQLGTYYTLDMRTNAVVAKDVDLERLGRELGALKPFEELQ